jgi:hypothetical protein
MVAIYLLSNVAQKLSHASFAIPARTTLHDETKNQQHLGELFLKPICPFS